MRYWDRLFARRRVALSAYAWRHGRSDDHCQVYVERVFGRVGYVGYIVFGEGIISVVAQTAGHQRAFFVKPVAVKRFAGAECQQSRVGADYTGYRGVRDVIVHARYPVARAGVDKIADIHAAASAVGQGVDFYRGLHESAVDESEP